MNGVESQALQQVYYDKGFDQAVSQTHKWRNASNCCAYMLSLLKPTDNVLDVGCGPGSITCDLARFVKQGKVIGIEPTVELLEEGRRLAESLEVKNVKFMEASAYRLPFEDNTFDIVHCHQVLVHMGNPLNALKEMQRVVKRGGYVCCKEADLETTTVYPEKYKAKLTKFFTTVTQKSTNVCFGRQLKSLFLKSGVPSSCLTFTTSNWTICTEEERKFFSDMFIQRAKKSKERVFQNEELRNETCKCWKEWSEDENSVLIMVHGEIVCKVV